MNPEVLPPDDVDLETGEELVPIRSLRHPAVPVSLNELAALRGEALEVLDARILILETARKRAIRMTSPEDWVLFKSPDERITGYLQDAGCDRIRDITGIEVYDVSRPERIVDNEGKTFMYIVTGSGRSRLTLQTVEAMEGGRQSTDDFCRDKTGAALDLAVRKAARANLDGNITRELAGLKTVPLDDLVSAWAGTTPPKKWENCRKGRGFGTGAERLGALKENAPQVEPPTCPVCKTPDGRPLPLLFREGKNGRESFYGCKNYSDHPNVKAIVNAAEWVAKQGSAKPANGGGDAAASK